MAASFLKRKPKDPDRPQRREIPVLEADAASGLSAAQAQERLDGGWVGSRDYCEKRFYLF